MKVVHITPTYFDNVSIIGGGERYPTELATWMSELVDTTMVSFSDQRKSYYSGKLKVEIYPVKYFVQGNKLNPLTLRYLISILDADVVHIHHINTLISDLGCLVSSLLLRKKVFVTDYGGGGSLFLNQKLPILQQYQNVIAYSEFGMDHLPKALKQKRILIKGGIDTRKFYPNLTVKKENAILFVGRLLPHKGINYLIEAFRLLNLPDYTLRIVGRPYHSQYLTDLREQAKGSAIKFVFDADDKQILQEYQTAKVTVLPSVHTTCYGDYTPVPELMGFTLLESQACGTPVVCTNAGAMHEFVQEARTGFVVEQNSGEAIALAIQKIINLPPKHYDHFQTECRKWVDTLSWNNVVKEHICLYKK